MAKNINSILKTMRTEGKLQNMKGKGDAGEDAVLQLILERHRHTGGFSRLSIRTSRTDKARPIWEISNWKMVNM